jgi:hypothetical protein
MSKKYIEGNRKISGLNDNLSTGTDFTKTIHVKENWKDCS